MSKRNLVSIFDDEEVSIQPTNKSPKKNNDEDVKQQKSKITKNKLEEEEEDCEIKMSIVTSQTESILLPNGKVKRVVKENVFSEEALAKHRVPKTNPLEKPATEQFVKQVDNPLKGTGKKLISKDLEKILDKTEVDKKNNDKKNNKKPANEKQNEQKQDQEQKPKPHKHPLKRGSTQEAICVLCHRTMIGITNAMIDEVVKIVKEGSDQISVNSAIDSLKKKFPQKINEEFLKEEKHKETIKSYINLAAAVDTPVLQQVFKLCKK